MLITRLRVCLVTSGFYLVHDLYVNAQDLIIGGNEAFGTLTEWAILELVRNPEKMQILQNELDSVVGRSRPVEESDFPKLSYFKAVVRETMRLYPTLPLLVPRETEVATTVHDYYIPPKTLVLVNAWRIGRDSSYYPNPEIFEPERFLDCEETADYNYLAFGGGRRVCPGGKLGLAMLQLTLASLVHAYDWAPPLGVEPRDIEVAPTTSVVLAPRFPIYFQTTPRLDLDVYGIRAKQL
jgi:cytochrome P450